MFLTVNLFNNYSLDKMIKIYLSKMVLSGKKHSRIENHCVSRNSHDNYFVRGDWNGFCLDQVQIFPK